MRRAVSSAVERLVYTEDVGGSIPSPPTIFLGARLSATGSRPPERKKRWPIRPRRGVLRFAAHRRRTYRKRCTHHSEGNKPIMPISMYAIAVPTFQKHLTALDAILDKADGLRDSEKDRSVCAALGTPLSGYVQLHPSSAGCGRLREGRRRKACGRAGAKFPGYRDDDPRTQAAHSKDACNSSAPSNPSRWKGLRRSNSR